MPWISNRKHKIKEKSLKSSQSSSKVVGLGLADLWEFPTLLICNFTVSCQAAILYNEFKNYEFKMFATSLRGQWVNQSSLSMS